MKPRGCLVYIFFITGQSYVDSAKREPIVYIWQRVQHWWVRLISYITDDDGHEFALFTCRDTKWFFYTIVLHYFLYSRLYKARKCSICWEIIRDYAKEFSARTLLFFLRRHEALVWSFAGAHLDLWYMHFFLVFVASASYFFLHRASISTSIII